MVKLDKAILIDQQIRIHTLLFWGRGAPFLGRPVEASVTLTVEAPDEDYRQWLALVLD